MATCIVRGTGDVGSAVAHVLFSHGHEVVMHDSPAPAHLRRGMSFVDALFSGVALLEEIVGKKARDGEDLAPMSHCRRGIPVFAGGLDEALRRVRPDILVDARMRKRDTAQDMRTPAYVTIGLGPNFVAGGNVDVAIETAWGGSLGAVITSGPTKDLEGEPRPIAGAGRERNVYASSAGEFRTRCIIGQRVAQGEIVGTLGGEPTGAPLAGCIRGLTHDGVYVAAATKIVEIDPRADPSTCFGLGERPRRIALGVLAAVERRS